MESGFETLSRRPFRSKRVLAPFAGLLLVATVAARAFIAWHQFGPDQTARDAPNEAQVDIPVQATKVSATYDRIRIQGGCSTLSFLLPKLQWRGYVTEFMVEPLVSTEFGPNTGCEPIPHDCVDAVGPSDLTGYRATDHLPVIDHKGGEFRHLYVVPDCEPGKTLIAWSAFDT